MVIFSTAGMGDILKKRCYIHKCTVISAAIYISVQSSARPRKFTSTGSDVHGPANVKGGGGEVACSPVAL